MSECQHEMAELTCWDTDQPVLICCECDQVLDATDHHEFPTHWQLSTYGSQPGAYLGEEILSSVFPEPGAGRYVSMCGNCGHLMNAVHGGFFETMDSADRNGASGFFDMLAESLCPECGGALFRWSIIVTSYAISRQIRDKGDPSLFIKRYANTRYWRGESGGAGAHKSKLGALGQEWEPRCPACAYPARATDGREFDFHHWDYDDDIGCRICRDCHSFIHRGKRARDQVENGDWESDAVQRLYDRGVNHGLSFHNPEQFMVRFNIPDNLSAIVSEVISDGS